VEVILTIRSPGKNPFQRFGHFEDIWFRIFGAEKRVGSWDFRIEGLYLEKWRDQSLFKMIGQPCASEGEESAHHLASNMFSSAPSSGYPVSQWQTRQNAGMCGICWHLYTFSWVLNSGSSFLGQENINLKAEIIAWGAKNSWTRVDNPRHEESRRGEQCGTFRLQLLCGWGVDQMIVCDPPGTRGTNLDPKLTRSSSSPSTWLRVRDPLLKFRMV